MGKYQFKSWGLAAVLIVSLACAKQALFRVPARAESYHRRVSAIAAEGSTHFGSWVSQEIPVPEAAITMLRPNATISRKFTNITTGEQATFLLVQCRDARDLFGHYPPICYAAHGFRAVDSTSRDWQIDDLEIHGTAYTFSSTRPEELTSMIIYDFMILPNGTTCRDMEGVYASARDPRRRMFGAAQLQILMSTTLSQDQRDEIFRSLVKANQPTIRAILAGDVQQ
ncbi:MAG TPA: hypothetical protein VFE47_18265 [Tepidisphaeraceae bacterium]|nr:hypothetical protein [Tepidisphaeraceae bacterium]